MSITDQYASVLDPATVLRCAALYLQRYGWTPSEPVAGRGALFPATDVEGAVTVAVRGRHDGVFTRAESRAWDDAIGCFAWYLFVELGEHIVDEDGDDLDFDDVVEAWHDRAGRSAGEVVTQLRAAACWHERTRACPNHGGGAA